MDALKPCPFCGGIKLKFNKCASVIYCESCRRVILELVSF